MNRGKPFWEKRVSFGKYIGWKYKDVPTEYLEWFVKNAYKQMKNRADWAERELSRRIKLTTPS